MKNFSEKNASSDIPHLVQLGIAIGMLSEFLKQAGAWNDDSQKQYDIANNALKLAWKDFNPQPFTKISGKLDSEDNYEAIRSSLDPSSQVNTIKYEFSTRFEIWWSNYRNNKEEPSDYYLKKQIAYDAFYFGATNSSVIFSDKDLVTVDKVAKALALDMYPTSRWPADFKDALDGIKDAEGRYPVSWNFAEQCRGQAKAALLAMSY